MNEPAAGASDLAHGLAGVSEDRRPAGLPTSPRRVSDIRHTVRQVEAVRADRVRAVGTAFLRWRPFIVAPVAFGQGVLLSAADVPADQRVLLAVAMLLLLGLFVVEALLVRKRIVTERWLMVSLALTSAGLAMGIALSGGTASPLLTLILAPLVIAFAAFGRRRETALLLGGVVLAVGAIAVLASARALPWGALPEPFLGWARLFAFVGTVLLTWTGVAGLSDAYAEAGRLLDRLRFEAIEEASTRLRALAQVSAKVAHELKNPLAAVKALVQLERAQRPAGERSALRLGVVMDEIDRMEGLVRDYLAFTRPMSELQRTTFDVVDLMQEVALLLSARASAEAVSLTVAPGRASLFADRVRLREALFNLVDNAIVASPPRATVELTHAATARGHRLQIADRGPGIAPHITTALASGDAAYLTTRDDGSGLGLTIARAAIVQHGGELCFRARDGGGTVAIIELAATPDPEGDP